MKKLVAMALTLCMMVGIIPFGTLSANAKVGDYTFYEVEPNDSMATADRIYNDYTVSGNVYGYDIDYYKFTLSSKSTVSIITVADYSIFMGGVFNSSDKAVAANSIIDEYSYDYYMFSLSATLNAGTYYYVVFNEDGLEIDDYYTFYLSISPSNDHKHSYDNACDETCNICEAKRTAPHSYGTGVVTKAATCSKEGVRTYKCSACGATKTETIEKVNHKYYNISTTKATTSQNGKIVKKCKVCKKNTSTVINYAKTFKLSSGSYTYNGKAKKPSVTVKTSNGKNLKNGTDYTLTYSNNKNVGKSSVKVTLKGNYTGTKTVTFAINPKATSVKSVASGKKQFTVNWNKQATQTSGYQVQYSTNKNFKNAKTVTVTSSKTTSKTVKNLKAKTKYYVRVRTYKTVKNTKYYSAWSATKNVTTKK